jgi:hypothetical protein
MTFGVLALCYLLWVKQGYKNITGGVLYGLIQSPNRTIIQCLTNSLPVYDVIGDRSMDGNSIRDMRSYAPTTGKTFSKRQNILKKN